MTSVSSNLAAIDRFRSIRLVYGEETFKQIQTAKILVVGAGGIGCELLKNLVLTGFMDITVLDLDTIDVSNLNRQFLFRRHHVGQSKAQVARESVLQFQPTAKITAIHGNIKEAQYDHDWFTQFTLVMNALDNLEARRHVNRLCLSAGRTLLESGTQGYAGQSSVIRGGVTECFECSPVPTPKTFAVCTIRNTPDKPVHTVVWAKALYAALYGPPDEGNIMSDAKMDLEEGVAEAQTKTAALKNGTADPYSIDSYSTFAVSVFRKLFTEEIEKQRGVKERWKDRAPPTALNLEELLESLRSTKPELSSKSYRTRDQSVLTPAENAGFLLHTVDATLSIRSNELGDLTFDKDDELSMDFVALAANLRMTNFGIGIQSRFSLKGIAGNIVHAIATTNAIAAGLMVSDAIKVLQNRIEACNTMWITRRAPGLLTSQALAKPNPACFVCAQHTLELTLNTHKWTLKRLYEAVLKKKLSMNEPSIDVLNRDNFIGTQDDHEEDNPDYLLLPLSSSGIRLDHGALLAVEDQSQQLKVQLRLCHREEWNEEEEADEFILTGELTPPTTTATSSDTANTPMTDDLNEQKDGTVRITTSASPTDVDMIDVSAATPTSATRPNSSTNASAGTKRKLVDTITEDEMELVDTEPKRIKASPTNEADDVIELD